MGHEKALAKGVGQKAGEKAKEEGGHEKPHGTHEATKAPLRPGRFVGTKRGQPKPKRRRSKSPKGSRCTLRSKERKP